MRAVALALALLSAGPALAADTPPYPSRDMLVDAMTETALRVACEPPEGTRMTCAFTEIRVEPVGAGTPMPSKDECATVIPALRASMVDGVPPQGSDPEAFLSRFARRTETEKADMAALFDAVAAYCAGAPGSADRLAEVMRARSSRTCRLAISTYALDFDFADGRWETRSAPSADGCGTVRFGSFAPASAGSRDWTYRVGSRSGDGAGASCPTTPDLEHIYARLGIDMQADCDYLRFTD